jgi:hypothetical protein
MPKQFTIVGINAGGAQVYRMMITSLAEDLLGTLAYERECAVDCGAVRVVIDIAE